MVITTILQIKKPSHRSYFSLLKSHKEQVVETIVNLHKYGMNLLLNEFKVGWFDIIQIKIKLNMLWLEIHILFTLFKVHCAWTSLVAQWLRICLPMQGTRVQALVRKDLTCHGAAKPVCHNY